MGRAPCCDKANVKRGPWSTEEDHKLKSYIENHGTGGNWIALPQKIGLKRCGKSCRLRWLNYLRPNIRHGGFTEDEDNLICSLYISIGSRWSIIATQLPGRTDNDIKNYWNTRLKKKILGTRQRRENKFREAHNQNHNYDTIMNEYSSDFGPNPPPHLVVAAAAGEPANSLADISFTTPTEARFSQLDDQNLGNICYGSSYDVTRAQFNDQKLPITPSSLERFCGSSDLQGFIGAPPPADYVPAFDETTTDGMVHGMSGQLDGHGLLSAPEMIISWGDHAADVICPRKTMMSQDQWSFFDGQRLLGYSE